MNSKIHTDLSTGFLQGISEQNKMIVISIAFFVLVSCSSSRPRAPISDRTQPPPIRIVSHTVVPGDTLYSIAWRYGMNYKQLAINNRIDSNFSIFPGQIIHLDDTPRVIARAVPRSTVVVPARPAPRISPPSVRQPKSQSIQHKSDKRSLVTTKSLNKPAKVIRSEKKSKVVSKPVTLPMTKGQIRWRWPTSGRVLTNFYAKQTLKEGIDIAGKKGDSVIAAASGEVVYAGSGLRGYGKLVIIKHSDVYLSAYAHNNRLRVKEGETVKAGQHIADVGSTGTGTNGKPKLHFQIRRNGKPVDPLPLLPKRKW